MPPKKKKEKKQRVLSLMLCLVCQIHMARASMCVHEQNSDARQSV